MHDLPPSRGKKGILIKKKGIIVTTGSYIRTFFLSFLLVGQTHPDRQTEMYSFDFGPSRSTIQSQPGHSEAPFFTFYHENSLFHTQIPSTIPPNATPIKRPSEKNPFKPHSLDYPNPSPPQTLPPTASLQPLPPIPGLPPRVPGPKPNMPKDVYTLAGTWVAR